MPTGQEWHSDLTRGWQRVFAYQGGLIFFTDCDLLDVTPVWRELTLPDHAELVSLYEF